jgi:hypothetical protein
MAAFLAGAAAAAPLAAWLWQFMVDDALIIARYAHHLAIGEGYRFNIGGPITDGVTPLGFAYLLAPLSSSGVLAAFGAAKVLGLVAWLAGAGSLGLAIEQIAGNRRKWLALALCATSAPLAAWSVAGMETGVAMGLGALAASARALGRERLALSAAAWLAAWRPEATALAVALGAGPPNTESAPPRYQRIAWVLIPVCLVTLLRLVLFGHAAPLGAIAKPSDLLHGAVYALACLLLCGPLAAFAYKSLTPWARGLLAAVLAHWLAMLVVGGDWMPLSRLAVVALPAAILVSACALANAPPAWAYPRWLIGLVGPIWVLFTTGPRAAAVGHKRMEVVSELCPEVAKARVVAALDVGWVGACGEMTVVDLAGVTDPAVAVLPGGHTSKPIPHSLLSARGVDALVLRLAEGNELAEPWTHSGFATYVELDVAAMPRMARDFAPAAQSSGALRYVLLRRRSD